MKISPRTTHRPLVRPNTPSYMRTDSVLIQTDGGRRFDASIRYNRIIEDPYQRNTNSALKPFLVLIVAIALFASIILFSERLGFSFLPLAVSDRKYFGMIPNYNGSYSNIEEEEESGFMDSTSPTDDNIDEFSGSGDDDARDIESDASFEEGHNINNSSGFDNRNDTLAEEESDSVLIEYAGNYTTANLTNGTLESIIHDDGGSGDDSRYSSEDGVSPIALSYIRDEREGTSKGTKYENQEYDHPSR